MVSVQLFGPSLDVIKKHVNIYNKNLWSSQMQVWLTEANLRKQELQTKLILHQYYNNLAFPESIVVNLQSKYYKFIS